MLRLSTIKYIVVVSSKKKEKYIFTVFTGLLNFFWLTYFKLTIEIFILFKYIKVISENFWN